MSEPVPSNPEANSSTPASAHAPSIAASALATTAISTPVLPSYMPQTPVQAPAQVTPSATAEAPLQHQLPPSTDTPGPVHTPVQAPLQAPAPPPAQIPGPIPIAAPPGPFDSTTPTGDRPNKRQKVAIACDVCRAKKVKCDSIRPVCGPCSKRQHGAPCEYTTVTRTSHGPSKGYVHHLELKLRELQKETGRDVGVDDLLGGKRDRGSLVSRTPPPEPASHLRHSSSSYSQQTNSNWGAPVQWQQRPAEESTRQPFSTAPPPPQGPHEGRDVRDVPMNGSATPDVRRAEAEPVVNGTYIHHKEPSVEERKDVHNRSPAIDSPSILSASRKRPRSIDYILPSRKTADSLVEAYWDTAYQLFPIMDYDAFSKSYQSIWSGAPENESQVMCTLNLVFALAASFTDSMESRGQSAKTYFNRAQELFDLELWNTNGQTLESIQCLLLVCQYMQSQSSARQTWVFVGLAISMADSLFLHLASSAVLNERQKTVHQVVWHGCLYMKRILAMHSKRPSMIDEVSATMIAKPFHRHIGLRHEELHFYHSLLLSEILDEILLQNHKTRTHPESHPDFGHETTLTSVTKLDGKLSRWRSELPPPLHSISYRDNPGSPLNRQANSIRLQYYNARILLFRPILINWCRLQVDPRDPNSSEDFKTQTSLASATLCLHSSLDMIEFIFTRLPPLDGIAPPQHNSNHVSEHHGASGSLPLLPAWWDILSYLHTAALVLIASRLNRSLCLSVPGTTLEDAFNTALDCLRHFARSGLELGERSVRTLESLAFKTDRARCDIELAHANAAAQAAQGVQPPPPMQPPQLPIRVVELPLEVRGLDWVDVGVYDL